MHLKFWNNLFQETPLSVCFWNFKEHQCTCECCCIFEGKIYKLKRASNLSKSKIEGFVVYNRFDPAKSMRKRAKFL